MPTLTDLSTIRDLCARYDFALSKGFGQNFIINPGICPRIAEAAGIGPGWGALEVGPGIGVLTEQLCKRADKVVSIEVDKRLPPLLEETMAGYDNFKLVLNDVLKVDLKALLAEEFGDKPVAVCANLPYYITSPILMRLLEEKLPIRNITVMVQKEAAQRLCAAPGTRDAGAISYAVAYYAEPKLLFSVQPGSFYPAPKVTSAVIRLDVRKTPAVQVPNGDEAAFFALIRAAFSQRRKTAANAIANGLHLPKAQVLTALQSAGLDERARPEQLTLEDYCALQKLRFNDRLNCTFDIAIYQNDWNIPKLLLQPIVENSIRHGIEPCTHPCLIEIKISELDEEALLITISDNGTGFDIGQLEEGGIGIRNVKERLSSYSPESTMEIQSSIGNGTCTTIKLKKVTEAVNS